MIPRTWGQEITIYNKYTDPDGIIHWFRTSEIEHTFWGATKEKSEVTDATRKSSRIVCRIPENERFLDSVDWNNLPFDEKPYKFTLDLDTIIVRGFVLDELDERQNTGIRPSTLREKYRDDMIEVLYFSNNTRDNRGLPHYSVKGS